MVGLLVFGGIFLYQTRIIDADAVALNRARRIRVMPFMNEHVSMEIEHLNHTNGNVFVNVVNESDYSILIDNEVFLEKYRDGMWYVLNLRQRNLTHPRLAIYDQSQAMLQSRLRFNFLNSPGSYRIRRSFSILQDDSNNHDTREDGFARRHDLFVYFDIE